MANNKLCLYSELCQQANIVPITDPMQWPVSHQIHDLADYSASERLTAALGVLVDLLAENNAKVQHIDPLLLDGFIAQIDRLLNEQLDEILHQPDFQRLESIWRSLKFLIDRTDFHANIKVEILDVNKENLRQDFITADDITQTGLYHHIYTQEYDLPGGEPFAAVIGNYEFNAQTPDIQLLKSLAKVAATTHCPFISAVGPEFFYKQTYDEVMQLTDLQHYFEKAEYVHWSLLREMEDARYVGLTFPSFLLRLPYGEQNPVHSFNYQEDVFGVTADKYLWGNASFAFASTLARSFKQHGWAVHIRGPHSGGKVENLPLHQFNVSKGIHTKPPTQVLIPETRELELANLGFIPLSYYKNSDYACFFSANSIQKPAIYTFDIATANSRINARLPYVFLSARLGHYLKVLQRENIGAAKNCGELEQELNAWLQTLVTKMNDPSPELAATHPLREGEIRVQMLPDNPGFYQVLLYAIPHFQIEGIDVRLSLVAKMPANPLTKREG